MLAPIPSIAAHSKGSSFRFPMRLLPKKQREAMFTLYALCRTMDNAIDDAPNAETRLKALGYWREQVAAMATGKATDPVAVAFQPVMATYTIPLQHLEALLAGLAMDCTTQTLICRTPADLERYCYGVAGTVGLMSLCIFGVSGAEAESFAVELGHALQLTNILRDQHDDAKAGRTYIPPEWSKETLAVKARGHFLAADAKARFLPPHLIAPALAMRDVYAYYYLTLKARGWQWPGGKISLSPWQKTRIVLRSAMYYLEKFKPVEI